MFIIKSINFIGFQEPVTPIMEGIIDLHNYIFIFLIGILIFVLLSFIYIMFYHFLIPTYFYSLNITFDIYALNKGKEEEKKKQFIRARLGIFYMYHMFINYCEIKYYAFMIPLKNQMLLYGYNNYLGPSYREKKMYLYYNRMAFYYLFELVETRKIVHGTIIEIVWTIIPSIILVCIAVPSFSLLYSMDEIIDPKLTVKAIGSQWFWSYEYGQEIDEKSFDYFTDSLGYNLNYKHDYLVYDSILLTDDLLNIGDHRLLEVDHQMILPINTHVRLIITATDVLHSWAVPALGIKVDAIPGRLSQIGLYIKHEGIFYGQCSELCGINHGFMPIAVKALSLDKFLNWYYNIDILWN